MYSQKVAIYRQADMFYPEVSPFHPERDYPEYPYKGYTCRTNQVYDGIRETFRLLGLDKAHIDSPEWNPLGEFVRPGDQVVIKPNFVFHQNRLGFSIDSVVTHGSVVRAVLDYVAIALRGKGTIIIGDAPLQTCDFDCVLRETGLEEVVEFTQRNNSGLRIALCDFRQEWAVKDNHGIIRERYELDKSGKNHVVVNLGQNSYLAGVSHRAKNFRVTNYNPGEMLKHHNNTTNEYLIARAVLEADCFINLPKLKTHRKAGLTAALKNTVGINGSKDWLPHHSVGAREEDGDAYRNRCWRKRIAETLLDRAESAKNYRARLVYGLISRPLLGSQKLWPFPDKYFEGSWYGNDTLWRTILDLNRIVLYADPDGVLRCWQPQRRYFALVDAVVAGEGEGPLEPTPKRCGVLVAGTNPVTVDTCCAMIMGFDPDYIPVIKYGWQDKALGPGVDWELYSNWWRDKEDLKRHHCDFLPSAGWKRLHVHTRG